MNCFIYFNFILYILTGTPEHLKKKNKMKSKASFFYDYLLCIHFQTQNTLLSKGLNLKHLWYISAHTSISDVKAGISILAPLNSLLTRNCYCSQKEMGDPSSQTNFHSFSSLHFGTSFKRSVLRGDGVKMTSIHRHSNPTTGLKASISAMLAA